MADVFQLVGKESRQYQKDGQQRFYCGLHLVGEQGAESGVEGSKVQTLSCPQNVDPSRLRIGAWYELKFNHYRTSMGYRASVSDLVPVDSE